MSICGDRHLAERLGRFALRYWQARTFQPLLQQSINRRRCRSLGASILRALSERISPCIRELRSGLTSKRALASFSLPIGGDDVLDARRWTRILSNYSTPSRLRSVAELAITALPLVMLWTAAWFTFSLGHAWASLLIAIPAAGFLVRLFMIQHDCGHGAFFAEPSGERLGRPRHRRAHADALRLLAPHACHPSCHLRQSRPPRHRRCRYADGARISRAARGWGRLNYRLYRHPLVMFGVGPAYLFLAAAAPAGRPDARRLAAVGQHAWRPISRSPSIVAVLIWLIGLKAFLLVHLPIMLLAAIVGVWLFYVQHQFEHTFWDARRALESARSRPARQLALRSAAAAALVHRQYRHPPRASPAAAASPTTGCRACCATTRSCATSAA